MLIRKRNGEDVTFDKNKIAKALEKANNAVSIDERLSIAEIVNIADSIEKYYIDNNTLASVESVQDIVINKIMQCGKFKLAKEYITYRYQHELLRKGNSTDEEVFHIVNGTSDEIREENSNKNTDILPTQRDYIAGIVSKDITDRYLLPSDILQAHNDGLIHFHDKDYFVTKEHNCGLVNLDDMLQNGTVISETKIDKPHRFSTACNIATQIIAQVASSQYGGQSITLTHIAKFVNISRQAIRKEVTNELDKAGVAMYSDMQIDKIVEMRLRKEVSAGIQTIQYQVLTLMTTNGQTPFITVFLNLSEAEGDKILEKDLAMCIEEVLLQRIQGIKNEVGVYVTPAFPKLIYVLDENNIYKGSPYRYLTELAAKCTAKQMVPDYISAKIMRQLKGGDVYTCMGCTDKDAIISYILNGIKYTESISRAWDRCAELFKINIQPDGIDKYIDCDNMTIWDSEKNSYVDCYRIIRNHSDEWLELTFSNGRILNCTPDHPFETINRGVVYAKDLTSDDKIKCDISCSNIDGNITFNEHKAWLLGFTLCDGCYDHHITASIAYNSEYDIRDAFITRMKEEYEYDVRVIEQHRGPKGDYLDLMVISNKYRLQRQMAAYLISKFEGFQKINRHIPNEVFTWDRNARLSFLAGMIDADGYININNEEVQIGSTNKELAMQQLLLAQSLGMPAYVYRNHYNSNYKCKVRYAVSFCPTKELIDRIVSKKKSAMIPTERIGAKRRNSNAIISLRKRNIVFIPNEYSYDVTTASEHFTVDGIYSHNCRSFLTPDRFTDTLHENIANALNWDPTKHKYYGRFNQGVVTINLPYVAMQSSGNEKEFWKLLDDALELCHRALRIRHERLLGTPSDVAPIIWQYGGYARLKKGETIDKLLYNGYSTISLGFAGLYECTKYMTGHSHTDEEGKPFALAVMHRLNDKTTEWKTAENIDYSLYGTPLESTTYKFAKALQSKFGIVKDVSDHNYITNSYHVNVRENIDAFTKLKFESEFQALSPGGAISYVEVPNLQNNIEAVLSVIEYIYENIMYAELNTKSDYCQVCGWDGEIKIIEEGGKLLWECPKCGNRDQNKMNVTRRTCGYIGTQFWNQGRTQEIKDRVLHL